jgi:cell division protein FtsQ
VNNRFKTYDEPENIGFTPDETPVSPAPKKKKGKGKRILVYSILGILAVGVVSLIVFAGNQQKAEKCWKVEIEIQDQGGKFFIDNATVLSLIQSKNDSLIGKQLTQINIQKLHDKLSAHPSVKSADVFTTVDGRCVVKIQQRQPIARVFNQDGSSMYIDIDGFTMPVTPGYAMKLPVFTGNIQEKLLNKSIEEARKDEQWAFKSMLDDIYYFTMHIRKDEFLLAQVEHVFIDAARNVQIIPRVGEHRIFIGDVNDLDMKFKKLKTFYANTLQTRDLNMYSSIHLEYEGQVVCERKQLTN